MSSRMSYLAIRLDLLRARVHANSLSDAVDDNPIADVNVCIPGVCGLPGDGQITDDRVGPG
jgi:hypothetical protein